MNGEQFMSSIYDKPSKYNKAARAHVVTVQRLTKNKLGIYEVTLEHGDIALPHGFITGGTENFHTYMFAAGHSRDYSKATLVGSSRFFQEAVEDVRKAWEQSLGG
jgi:hypothetical protein